MVKRIAIALIWFYAGWYAGNALVHFLDLTPMLGPVVGALAAFVTVADPRGLIWKKDEAQAPQAPIAAQAAQQA